MTIVAWDGKQITSDEKTCFGNLKKFEGKFIAVKNGFCAVSGYGSRANELVNFVHGLMNGKNPYLRPATDAKEDFAELLHWDGQKMWLYSNGQGAEIVSPPFAMGAAANEAYAVMCLGFSAVVATSVAIKVSSDCEGQIRFVNTNPVNKKKSIDRTVWRVQTDEVWNALQKTIKQHVLNNEIGPFAMEEVKE